MRALGEAADPSDEIVSAAAYGSPRWNKDSPKTHPYYTTNKTPQTNWYRGGEGEVAK